MHRSWNRAALNPRICKILVGTVAAGLLAVFLFHQPWFPVEISRADTGVLVALPAPVPSTTAGQISSSRPSKAAIDEREPITVPLAKSAPDHSHGVAPVVQTAELSPPAFLAGRKQLIPTYSQHIAPLIQKHCVHCHSENSSGLTLQRPDEILAAAARIAEVTASRRMPPWKPRPGYGQFQNDRRLSDAEIEQIQQWARAGAALGNVADVQVLSSEPWQLGQPTVAYQLPQPFKIPASQAGLQWNFVIPTGVKRELFLTGLEWRPGNRALVKRMVLSYDPTGAARRQDQQTPEPGFPSTQASQLSPGSILSEWEPGMTALPFPEETAYRIPAGADLVLTVDYAATPIPTSDPWLMGLHIARSAPKHRLGRIEVAPLVEHSSTAPRGSNSYIATYSLPAEATVFSTIPDVSSDGSGVRISAKTPGGQVIPFVEIESWESRWKMPYRLLEPITLPKDSVLMVEAWHSNTPDAPLSASCVFEIGTPNPADLEPLIRQNGQRN